MSNLSNIPNISKELKCRNEIALEWFLENTTN